MKLFRNFLNAALAAAMAAGFLAFTGCEVDRDDVADAREHAAEEREDVTEAIREGQHDIAEAQADDRHETMRPPYGDTADDQDDVTEAREDAQENIQEEKEEAADAEAEADRLERELAAKEARETFVTDIRARLEAADTRIEAMDEEAAELEGAEREAFDARLESIREARDKVETEIDEVESAETLNWETHKADAESAMTELEQMINQQ